MRIRDFKYAVDIQPSDLVFTVDIPSANYIMDLPIQTFNGNDVIGSSTVDWGDGTGTETYVDKNTSRQHTYANAGTYTVTWTAVSCATGVIDFGANTSIRTIVKTLENWGWARTNTGCFDNCTALTAVNAGNLIQTGSGNAFFRDCTSLTTVVNFPDVTWGNSDDMFRRCTIAEIPANFDFSTCTSLNNAFNLCTGLASCYAWDFSGCTSMESAFENCFDLVANVVVPNNTTTGNVTNWFRTFQNANMYDMGSWNYTGATSLGRTFYDCKATVMQHLDLSTIESLSWTFRYMPNLPNFNNGITMNTTTAVFTEATWGQMDVLTDFPLIDTSMVSDFRATWFKCPLLNNFPAIDCTGATDLISTWWDCTSLDTIGNLNLSTIDTLSYDPVYGFGGGVFENTAFTTPPENLDYTSILTASRTFANCDSIITLSETFTLPNVTSTYELFRDCEGLTTLGVNAAIRLIPSLSRAFYSCGSLTNIPNWDLSNKTSVQGIFAASPATSFPNFNVTGTLNVGEFFAYCNSLTSFPTLDTSSATSFAGMFDSNISPAMTSGIPAYDYSNGVNFDRFAWWSNIISIPATMNNLVNADSCYGAFYNTDLTDYSGFNAPNATNWDRCFTDCTSMNVWHPLSTTATNIYQCYDNCTSLAGTAMPTYSFPNLDQADRFLLSISASTQSVTDFLIELEAVNALTGTTKRLHLGSSNYFTAQAGAAVTALESRNWIITSGGGI